MAKHIGIVACSAEGAALCYRTIAMEGGLIMGRHAHPELSMHTHPLSEYMDFIYRDDWKGVANLMVSSATKLASVGADFCICPDNTIHKVFEQVRARSPLPWLHIAEEVAKEARHNGYRKIGITGTRYLVESEVYPEKLQAAGLEFLRPEAAERERINSIIFDELVNGKFTIESLSYLQQVIERLKKNGCDAVVLGCTEIPLLVTPKDSPLPTLDSTRLLAKAAVRHAMAEGKSA